ncbi:hypothetical protein [Methylobacterium planeticum]|uniref:Uncharacterized protein n=1 Tax=Methylobacterium planeticum TaxID=2615211 RepID=A0A6N6MKZ8_9HYPH|nr:hypothetical protein [Methylobacterium planeticum]KAB1070385.1 hypothetical protein F6X51_22655 [Methylobacterium planeticum]
MNDPSPTPLYVGESPVAVPIPRAVERAYLWCVAGLGGVATAALLIVAVATQSNAEAERIAAGQANGAGYLETLVSALATGQGRKPF